MLDFETLGNGADAIALSCGAVAFNRNGIIGEKYLALDLDDQIKLGRSFTASTLTWWMHPKQAAAREIFTDDEIPKLKVEQFLEELEVFAERHLKSQGETFRELRPVGNGANYDISLLENMIRCHHPKHEHAIFWKFWNVWDFRTLDHVFKIKAAHARPHGTYHNALGDARYQAECMIKMWQSKSKKKPKETITEDEF